MKQLLLCGVALCAFVATPAMAADSAEGVKLKLGGFFKGYVSYVNQDDSTSSIRNVDIIRATEVYFDGSTKLDNGLTVGAHIEATADVGDGFAIDESYAFFSGDWGRINFGGRDGVAYLIQVAAPSADKDVDGVSQKVQPFNFAADGIAVGETDYDQNISLKADKITYLTPVMSGFQGGVSYTPEADDNSRGAAGNDNDDNDADPSSDVWDLAVRYQGDVGETKLTLGAGYTVAQVETGTAEDRQAWNLGAVVGFKGFNIGASYQNDDEGDDNDDVDYVAVGVDYTMGDYVLGASYYNKNDDVGTEIDTDRYTVGVNYKAGPGISFRGSVEYLEADVTGGNDFDGTAVLVGTSIDF